MASPLSSTDPEGNEGAQRPPACAVAPVLRSLIPLMAGIAFSRCEGGWEIVAAGAPVLLLILFIAPSRWRILAISLTSFLLGLFLADFHAVSPDPSWERRPPREARLLLRVQETFNARKPGHVAGVGTILRAGLPVDSVRGHAAAYYLKGTVLVPGETVEAKAVLAWLPNETEPDDYQRYLAGRDIHLTLNQGTVLRKVSAPPALRRIRQAAYRKCQDILTAGCRSPEDPGNTLASMLLGNRALLTDERIDLYRKTGTYHLFAVSGLHVGSVAGCLFLIGRGIRLRKNSQLLIALLGTWLYVWLTGASPSAVRAGIMISSISLARLVLRQPHPFPALALSAWVVLVLNPYQLFHLGFQLSYAVVGAIILIGLPMSQAVRRRFGQPHEGGKTRLCRGLDKVLLATSDLLWVSLAASLASSPLILQHFNLITPVGVLVGMLLHPLATLCVMSGCVALLVGPIAGLPLGGVIPVMTWPAIRLMEWILHRCLEIPGAMATRSWAWPPAGTILTAAVLALAWGLQRARMQGRSLPPATYALPHLMVVAAFLAGLRQTG